VQAFDIQLKIYYTALKFFDSEIAIIWLKIKKITIQEAIWKVQR